MENCLKTQLKGSVQNQSLPVFGKISFKVKQNESNTNKIYIKLNNISSDNLTIESIEGSYLTCPTLGYSTETNEITIPANSSTEYVVYGSESADYTIVMGGRYIGFSNIQIGNSKTDDRIYFDIEGLKYKENNIISLYGPNISGNLNKLPSNWCSGITLNNTGVSGDLSFLSGLTILNGVDLSYSELISGNLSALSNLSLLPALILEKCPLISGDISSLIRLTKLVNLFLYRSTNIEGDIATLANGMVSEQRTKGTLKITCNSKIKLNGVLVGNYVIKTVRFGDPSQGGSMINPTAEELAQGWQVD